MKREAQSRWNIMKSINDDENRLKKIGIELQDEDEIIKKLFDFATKLSEPSTSLQHWIIFGQSLFSVCAKKNKICWFPAWILIYELFYRVKNAKLFLYFLFES